ncbi:hypothetical protein DFJ73DRAFT_782890 [Zopfochytrium polystomum]|nr:hypothetical protein DFJ73DRAFT_782890 [Zopfochytrium polystomum]
MQQQHEQPAPFGGAPTPVLLVDAASQLRGRPPRLRRRPRHRGHNMNSIIAAAVAALAAASPTPTPAAFASASPLQQQQQQQRQQQPVAAPCTAGVRYSGTSCPAWVVSYDVAISAGLFSEETATKAAAAAAAVAEVDAALAPLLLDSSLARSGDGGAAADDCHSALVALACGAAFPMCVNGTTVLPCRSACDAAVSACTAAAYATQAGGGGLLQLLQSVCASSPAAFLSLSSPSSSSSSLSHAAGAASSSSSSSSASSSAALCFVRTAASLDTNANAMTTTTTTAAAPPLLLPASCPAFFVPATSLAQLASSKTCDPLTGCCIPCPYQSRFYATGAFDRVVALSVVLNLTSAVLTAFVLISWAVLPGRRDHSGNLIMHLSAAVLAWMAVQAALVGNPRRVQCADEVTTATSKNNRLCFLHGAVVIFFSNAAVFLAAFTIFNVHLNIVWRTNILSRYNHIGIFICWTVPLVVTVVSFALARVDATPGIACFVAPDLANQFVFALEGFAALPALVATVWTVMHIAVKSNGGSWGAGSSGGEGVVGSRDGGYGANVAKATRSRRNYMSVVRTNWRALAFGISFVLTYMTFVVFFNLFVAPSTHFDASTPWVQSWKNCTLAVFFATGDADAAQNTCAEQVAAAGQVPPLASLYAVAVVTGSIGLWGFAIFGMNMQVLRDWAALCRGSRGGSGATGDASAGRGRLPARRQGADGGGGGSGAPAAAAAGGPEADARGQRQRAAVYPPPPPAAPPLLVQQQQQQQRPRTLSGSMPSGWVQPYFPQAHDGGGVGDNDTNEGMGGGGGGGGSAGALPGRMHRSSTSSTASLSGSGAVRPPSVQSFGPVASLPEVPAPPLMQPAHLSYFTARWGAPPAAAGAGGAVGANAVRGLHSSRPSSKSRSRSRSSSFESGSSALPGALQPVAMGGHAGDRWGGGGQGYGQAPARPVVFAEPLQYSFSSFGSPQQLQQQQYFEQQQQQQHSGGIGNPQQFTKF